MENNNNIELVLSPRLKISLGFINDNISNFILNLDRNDDYLFPFSYLDLADTDDQITFIQSNKYREIANDNNLIFEEEIWTSKKRSSARVGKLIGKLIPFFKTADIENFVNSYKSEFRRNENIKFQIVEGSDIIKYYNGRNYYPGNGSLNKSCMRHDSCDKFMNIYKHNSSKIKMVVLLDDYHKKILGRAILWKTDDDRFLMDRIYTIDDTTTISFKKYAEKNNWLYKAYQRFDAYNIVENGVEKFIPLRVSIHGNFEYFPYLDTMFYYNEKENYLTNDDEEYKNNSNVIKLREINGRHSGNENFVYDILSKKFIRLDDSIYCYYGDGYTHKNNAYFFEEYDEYAIPQKLRYSDYSKKIILTDRSVYSNALSSFVSSDDVMRVWLSNSEQDYLPKSELNKTYFKDHFNGDYYIKDLIIENNGKTYYKPFYEEMKNNSSKTKATIKMPKIKDNSVLSKKLF